MAIDSRCYGWCSLGPLAEGQGASIAESHVPGTGVITYRGTINLAGIHRPAPGTVVHLAYGDGQNWIARLPLRLRVLSSFANPLSGARTTAVSVGCDLAYFEDRKQPPAGYTEKELNPSIPDAIRELVAPPIEAAVLATRILNDLGLTAAGPIPLVNKISRNSIDMSGGFVSELGKLCQSEGYAARMNPAGLVEFINKAPGIGRSVLITEEDLIDLNPINTGDLPGDSVYSRYAVSTLKTPTTEDEDEDARKRRNWEREETISPPNKYIHNWTNYARTATGTRQARDAYGYPLVYLSDNTPVMETVYSVQASERRDEIIHINRSVTITTYNTDFDVATKRVTTTTELWGTQTSETVFEYVYNREMDNRPDRPTGTGTVAYAPGTGNELVKETTVEYSPIGPLFTSMGLQSTFWAIPRYTYKSSIREVVYERDEKAGITKVTTRTAVPFHTTVDGAETLSRRRQNRQPWQNVADLVGEASQLVWQAPEVRISTAREYGAQRRPSQSDRSRLASMTAPDIEQTETIIFSSGSAASQTAIELTPPYHSSPTISKVGSTWILDNGNAPQMVRHYGQTENRLLLGHRNGVGIQVLPENLPPVPMGLIYIRLNGCTAAYRISGTTWNVGTDGAVATADALFWGAVDGTVADAWFPLPPSTTALPSPLAVTVNASPVPANAMAIPGGFDPGNPDLVALFAALPTAAEPVFQKTVEPGVYLKPWHETIAATAATGSAVVVSTQAWIIQPPTEITAGAGSGATAIYLRFSNLFAASGSGATALGLPLRNLFAGTGGGAIIENLGAVVNLMAGSGSGVTAERQLWLMAGTGTGAVVPAPPDPDFDKVQLLIHGNGANNAQVFTDSSSFARAITVVDNTITSTTHYVFNGSSIYFDGNEDRLSFPVITIGYGVDACLDVWARPERADGLGIFGDYTVGTNSNMQALGILDGRLYCYWQGPDIIQTPANSIVPDTDYWFRLTRSSNIIRLFINGALAATSPIQNPNAMTIRDLGWSVYRGHFQGYLAEARVTVGTARTTASYALPTEPWPGG
jgi:hypothetical protein